MKLLGSKRTKTAAYHPEANGLVERFHRSLKSALWARMNQLNWLEYLLLVLLGLRTVVKDDLKCSSAETAYGTTFRLPGQFFFLRPRQKLLDMTSFVDWLTLKGKLGIQFARAVSKAQIRAKTFTDLLTRFCVGFSQDPHTAVFI